MASTSHPPHSSQRSSPARTGQSFALVDGFLTAYSLLGFGPGSEQKPLLLFLHGLGSAGSTFELVARALAPHYRVVLPDLLGSGRTAKPLIEYTPLQMAAHALSLLRELGLPVGEGQAPVQAIVGHSQGCAIAVELSHLLGGTVERLVLIDPPPPRGLRWMVSVTGLPLGSRTAEVISAFLPHRQLAKLWLSFLYADPRRITGEVLSAYAATSGGRGYAGATARALRALSRLELPIEEAPPTLLLWGARDRLFPAKGTKGARAWQARLRHSQLILLPAAGHCPHEEQPEATARAVLDYLAPILPAKSAA